jgi:anti-sigma B factor antagonist
MKEFEFGASSEYLADATRIVRVRGDLDLYTAPEFERALELNGAADRRVVVDLSECTFIDSTGLGILVKVGRRGDHDSLVIVANGVEVLRAFEVSGLNRQLVLYPTLESALNGGAISGSRDKEARTQALFREVNEQIERVAEDFGADGLDQLICECGNTDCTQLIELTRGEYERVREYANRFLVALNHENPETGSIVEHNERFVVVESYAGAPSQIARETDPRSQQHLRRTQPAAAEGSSQILRRSLSTESVSYRSGCFANADSQTA